MPKTKVEQPFPKYFYKIKIRHADGRIERVSIMAYNDDLLKEQARGFARIMGAKLLRIYGKKEVSWANYKYDWAPSKK